VKLSLSPLLSGQLDSVLTWYPSPGAWAPAQNSVVFRRWLLERPESGTGTVARESYSWTVHDTKCKHSLSPVCPKIGVFCLPIQQTPL